MTLPTAAELLKPILTLLADSRPLEELSICADLAKRFAISEDDWRALRTDIKSRKRVWDWRVHNACGLLEFAELLEGTNTKPAAWKATAAGVAIGTSTAPFAYAELAAIPVYAEIVAECGETGIDDDGMPVEGEGQAALATHAPKDAQRAQPEDTADAAERAFITHNQALAVEALEQLKKVHPTLFERIVVDVLVAMGYGGTERDAAKEIKPTGSDGGIDGTIKEDRLGLGFIYIQAKRWQGSVGRPEIQQFAGALQGKLAKRGVFITTSTFTNDAKAYVKGIEARIVLVDGPQLAELMIEHGIGVTLKQTLLLRALDHEYFTGQP